MGGTVISVGMENVSVADKMFPELSGWDKISPLSCGLLVDKANVFEQKIDSFGYGLGNLICFESDTGKNLKYWEDIFEQMSFRVAPTSQCKPVDSEQGFSVNTDRMFSVMEISPHYRKNILIIIAIVFFSFLMVVAILFALKLAKRLVVSVLIIALISTILSLGIHNMVPNSGIVWRYRNVVERSNAKLGRVTVFCSLASTTEMATALIQPEDGLIKLIKGWKEPVLMQKKGENAIVRGLNVGISKSLVLTMQIPLSAIDLSKLSVLNQSLESTSGEFSTPMEEILLRRFLCLDEGVYKYCGEDYSSDDFSSLTGKGKFLQGEVEFLTEFFSSYTFESVTANVYIPPRETGEILSNEITSLNLKHAESYGASLILHRGDNTSGGDEE